MMGLAEVAGIAHAAEDFLLVAQKHGFQVPPAFGNMLLEAVDAVLALVDGGPKRIDASAIQQSFAALKASLSAPTASVGSKPPESAPARPGMIEDGVTETMDRRVLLDAVRRGAQAGELSPPKPLPRATTSSGGLIPAARPSESEVSAPASKPASAAPAARSSSGFGTGSSPPGRAPSSVGKPSQSDAPGAAGSDRPAHSGPEELSLWGGPTAATEAQTGSRSAFKETAFVRVDGQDLEAVGESVDWLVAHQGPELRKLRQLRDSARRLQAISGDHKTTSQMRATLDALVEEAEQRVDLTHRLEHRLRRLRMVPIRDLFARYVRTVRDLAQSQGKEVRTVLRDQGSRIDRQSLERLYEPLLHLVRNSVDHGIEDPKARVIAGKPPSGTIYLGAEHMGSFLRITVEDDGAGVDPERVRSAIVDQGMVEPAVAAAMGTEELLGTLFVAGFTTRSTTSELSGRGYGLDIVKWEIERLGGSVGISSALGRGTRIELRTPFSASATRVVRFRIRDSGFALPVSAVGSVLELAGRSTSEELGRKLVRIDDEWVPMVAAERAVFGGSVSEPSHGFLILVHYSEIRVALVVSEPPAHAEVVIKPLGDVLDSVRLVTGAGILERDEIALILNPGELVSRAYGTRVALAEPTTTKGPQRVLLVEDSAITRRMVAQILRSFGYQVLEAGNGLQGLDVALNTPIDLLLTDLDMPEMDGITMIKKVRAETRLEALPIVVLSTRGSEEDKRLASAAGADAYLTKNSFSEARLREILERQLGS